MNSWEEAIEGVPMYRLYWKLKRLKAVFKTMNVECFGEVHVKVEKATVDLLKYQEQLQQNPMDVDMLEKEKACRDNLLLLKKAYNLFLRQKAKAE